ncbi:MAG TPA: hypothetical protein GXX53_10675 [Tissierellia bacterium]|nr:hypothetical protein [Tissierellia bacterium]
MAVINVTPLEDITALIASDSVNEGDVLLLEEGIYFQTVNVTKDYIRIVAKGPEVIFDGKSTLLTAFLLEDVVGVAILGIRIRNYRDDSIIIQSGSGNRIINNTFNNMLSDSIVLISSSGNLIWKNEICNCSDGIKLTSGSTNNWIIENIIKDGFVDAIETSSAADSNNAFISNIAIDHRDRGLALSGSNNLLLNNLVINHEAGIVIDVGNGSIAIGNTVKDCRLWGHIVFNEFNNYFAGDNRTECNDGVGMSNISDFSIFMDNEILYNGENGFTLDALSTGNLVMNNKLVCNIPENIVDEGTNNNLVNNIVKPCEPCKSTSDVCENCFHEE